MVDIVFLDSVEPEYYSGTRTFINFLGITDFKELVAKEAGFTTIRSIELLQNTIPLSNVFDFKYLKSIHYHLFQDLYDWAGKPRSYDMRKDGNDFTPAKKLPEFEAKVFSRAIDFTNTKCRPSIEQTAIKLASCLGIINIYHPFPEGNGRSQRIFISLLANTFNYLINWDAAHVWEIVETSKRVHSGDYEPLERLMKRIIIDQGSL